MNKIIKSKTHIFLNQPTYNFLYTNNPIKDIYEASQSYIEQGYTVYVDGTGCECNYTKATRDMKNIKILITYGNVRAQMFRLYQNQDVHEILFINVNTIRMYSGTGSLRSYLFDLLKTSRNIILYFNSIDLFLDRGNILERVILGKAESLTFFNKTKIFP